MKTLRRKWSVLIAAALAFLMTGCSLARPEVQDPKEDKFVGFHLVYEQLPPSMEELEAHPELYPPEDRSQWVEYGSEDMEIKGLGKVAFPREILIGRFDWGTGDYTFPGLEGRNCFLTVEEAEGGGNRYAGYNGLSNVSIAEGGEEESLSGAIYIGLPLGQTEWDLSEDEPEYCWTAYRVYQMADGTVYLDGTGNSYAGQGGMSFSEKVERTETVDGEETGRHSFEVKVEMKEVPRLESVTITQFGPENKALLETAFTTAELAGAAELTLEEDTLWLLVEEQNIDGTVKRTAYDREEIGEEGLSHFLVLLDEQGMGNPAYLKIKG